MTWVDELEEDVKKGVIKSFVIVNGKLQKVEVPDEATKDSVIAKLKAHIKDVEKVVVVKK